MSDYGFRELEHPADLALFVRGRDLSALFLHAARGLNHLLHFGPGQAVPQALEVTVELKAEDMETLMVDWLGEILFVTESRGGRWQVQELDVSSSGALRARLVRSDDAWPRRSIKAVTYSDLEIRSTAEGYETEIVLDA